MALVGDASRSAHAATKVRLRAYLRLRSRFVSPWPPRKGRLLWSSTNESRARAAAQRRRVRAPASDGTKVEYNLGLQDATRAFQRAYLAGILDATDWNVAEAARRMGVVRSYAYTLIRALGLQRSG